MTILPAAYARKQKRSRTHGGLTTYYIGDWLEYDVQGGTTVAARVLFRFQGQVIATNTPTQWVFLFSDHLGSVSTVADAQGVVLNTQDFDPWGKIQHGGTPQTSANYTGQRRDDTTFIYYHSRYYQPDFAHFISPDTIVPGSAAGSGGAAATLGQDPQAALRPLTVDFHEPGFTAGLNQENAFTQGKGFWFQLSNDARGRAKQPWGPANPQALNRYSYVLNNPVRYTDPTGHILYLTYTQAEQMVSGLATAIHIISNNLAGMSMASVAATLASEVPLLGIGPVIVNAAIQLTAVQLQEISAVLTDLQTKIWNQDLQGVGIVYNPMTGTFNILDLSNGFQTTVETANSPGTPNALKAFLLQAFNSTISPDLYYGVDVGAIPSTGYMYRSTWENQQYCREIFRNCD